MNRRSVLNVIGLFAIISSVNIFCHAQSQPLPLMTRHVREVTRIGEAHAVSRLSAVQLMRFDIVLPLRHQPELANFLQALYDPSSSSYRHFLTAQEFTERFGPSQEDYDGLIRFAKANAFTVVGGSRDAMDVQLQGTVGAVEKAFHVSMGVYQHPTENRRFFAPDREPTVDLPFALWHISGLDDYSVPHSALVHRNLTVRSNVVKGSCPSASYCGSDMRAAYYGGTTLTGTGQSVGLLEYYGYNVADINTYFRNASQTNTVPIHGISTDGSNLNCTEPGCDDTEQVLDITQAISMAPGLAALNFYVGNTDTALLAAMSTHSPLDAQLSSSWTWQPADPAVDDPFFQKFAAQGQTYFQAAGDSGAYKASSTYVFPADDDFVTTVGGTDLQVAGPGGAWSSETAWIDGGGGFFTPDAIPIPSWQQTTGVITAANKGSMALRNGPDVAAESNFDFYVCADQITCSANQYGGTSFAAPMWAGYMALINQQAVLNGNPPLGFLNPTIYSLGLGPAYTSSFHDIATGNNGTYSAITGFDLATGWGSPNGVGLINALSGAVAAANFTLSTSSGSVSIVQGGSGNLVITISPQNGFTAPINLSATGLPSGVTASFSPSIATSTSTLTLAASAKAAVGTVTITIHGASGSLNNTATFSLAVNSGGSPLVTLTPASLVWGGIKVGITGPMRALNLANSGTAALAINSVSISGDFAQTIVGSSCGSTLAPKKTCHIEVTFTPAAKGLRSGTVTITDNAPNSPQIISLQGTGK